MQKSFLPYNLQRSQHWDRVAQKLERWSGWGGYYQRRITRVYQLNIPPGQAILEIGCGSGNLLAALQPSVGVGLDLSEKMVARARCLHPQCRFFQCESPAKMKNPHRFDVILLSDTINDLWDVQTTLEEILPLLKPDGRLMLNFYSRFWEFPLKVATLLNLAKPTLPQNWLTVEDARNLVDLAGFEVIRDWVEVLMPLPIPLLGALCNQFLVRLWPFYLFAMTRFLVARPKPGTIPARRSEKTVSVIIPAMNEAGNITQIFKRVPWMGKSTELIFVEGHSSDDTLNAIQKHIRNNPQVPARLFRQSGMGKGDAVRLGFSKARGDVLMILDADLTMPPEYLPRFYEALASRTGDFVNGVRLVYPLEKHAMRFFNFIGNKFFSIMFTHLLGQPVKDTLCGTKALWKKDYLKIAANRAYFGDFDPFGDFDLLFGAAKLNLKIVDLPIRYQERVYGKTNIQRWRHGWLLLGMVIFGARRLKFV